MWPGWSRLAYWGWHVLPDLYISRRAAEADRSGLAAYGFKLFPAHVAAPRRVILSLHQRGWHVIHIKRRCLFEQTLSLLVAEQTGRYDGTHTDSVPRITIDPARFGAALHQRAGDIRKIERILASLSCLDIIYEDDLADSLCWDATVNRVCGFLGIAAAAAWSDYAKTWSAPYDQIVVNYRHLRDVYRAGLLGER